MSQYIWEEGNEHFVQLTGSLVQLGSLQLYYSNLTYATIQYDIESKTIHKNLSD